MKILVTIPVLKEYDNISKTVDYLRKQDYSDFEVFVCVNQPDWWWEDETRIDICIDNAKTIEYLNKIDDIKITVIDRSSKGKGWQKGKGGIGWARKIVMDAAVEKADDNDIIFSMDADTEFSPSLFRTIAEKFFRYPKAAALNLPYYHKLTGQDELDRLMLRYEFYLRNYLINLLRIGSPYSFTALGSAIALRVKIYHKIRGITPVLCGEDFYFLQKLTKSGRIMIYNELKVFPATRMSDRVLFGTGPSLIKGSKGDWDSYPLYSFRLFNNIKNMYEKFKVLFKYDVETEMSSFLKNIFKTEDLWTALRNNYKNEKQFVRACHTKVDALRILQYLKENQEIIDGNNLEKLFEMLKTYYPEKINELEFSTVCTDINGYTTSQLNEIRDMLVFIEDMLRKQRKYLDISKF
ncbi:MAG: glycosyltransferase [Bacteroidales bacterium]|nr:glycosyltransferase [Bacteroidales bacterium]